MFERYSDPARRVLLFARYEASQLGAPEIQTEHLLLGLIREPHGLANRLLDETAVSREAVRQAVEQRLVTREPVSSMHIDFIGEARQAFLNADQISKDLQHEDIGPEHLLLGLLSEPHSAAAGILIDSGMDLARTRELVARLRT